MNVSVGLNLAARLRRDLATRLFLILIIIALLNGCCSRWSEAVVSPASRSFDELKNNIVELRELSLKQEITLHPVAWDLSTIERTPLYANDFSPPPIDVVERAYKRMGLVSEGADLVKALPAYDRLEQMVFYDARERRVFVTPEASGLGCGFVQGNSQLAQEIPEVFGIVEALQEQNFHWHELLESLFPEDDRLASLALAKGDATLVALAHARRKKKVPTSAVDIQIIARLGAELEKSAAELPAVRPWPGFLPLRSAPGRRLVTSHPLGAETSYPPIGHMEISSPSGLVVGRTTVQPGVFFVPIRRRWKRAAGFVSNRRPPSKIVPKRKSLLVARF